MSEFKGKSFSPVKGAEGGPIRELTYNHPESDSPITIDSWPHVARDPYEQDLLEGHDSVKVESAKNASKDRSAAEGAGPSSQEKAKAEKPGAKEES